MEPAFHRETLTVLPVMQVQLTACNRATRQQHTACGIMARLPAQMSQALGC